MVLRGISRSIGFIREISGLSPKYTAHLNRRCSSRENRNNNKWRQIPEPAATNYFKSAVALFPISVSNDLSGCGGGYHVQANAA
jgi:hypothetical protein